MMYRQQTQLGSKGIVGGWKAGTSGREAANQSHGRMPPIEKRISRCAGKTVALNM